VSDGEVSTQLSKRELEILQMVATGASNKQIAYQLIISENTVKVHLRKIFEKLEVQSRTEATRYAIQKGLVSVAESEAEPTPAVPSRRTFAVSTRPPLARWQYFYLLAALALAVVGLALLLWPRQTVPLAPLLPVIYAQPATSAPLASANSDPNRWVAQAQMPTRRAGLAAAAYQNRLYAIGGVRDNNQATRAVEIFDPLTNTWSEGAAKPTAATDVSAAVLDDHIYVPGGCISHTKTISTLEIYDPQQDSWQKGRPLPEGRCGYGLAAYQGKLYLFGGWDGHQFVDTILVYSANEKKWQKLKAVLPRPLGYMGTALLNDHIYLVGGSNGEMEFDQVYSFDPSNSQWQDEKSLNEARSGLGLVGVENMLYAVGGGGNGALTTSEKYNPAIDTAWTSFETPLSHPWRNLGLAAIDTKLYAVGGWNESEQKFLDSVMSYQFLFQLFLPISTSEESNNPSQNNTK
jgi:DNA-binding CsgD family transcriptional regulator/N-acetylneuraminic acid mutarotase